MPFPPTKWQDIDEYDTDEVVTGYRDYRPGDPLPGPNHSDGYRWGWQNRLRDTTGEDDGYVAIRHEYIRESDRWEATPGGLLLTIIH